MTKKKLKTGKLLLKRERNSLKLEVIQRGQKSPKLDPKEGTTRASNLEKKTRQKTESNRLHLERGRDQVVSNVYYVTGSHVFDLGKNRYTIRERRKEKEQREIDT